MHCSVSFNGQVPIFHSKLKTSEKNSEFQTAFHQDSCILVGSESPPTLTVMLQKVRHTKNFCSKHLSSHWDLFLTYYVYMESVGNSLTTDQVLFSWQGIVSLAINSSKALSFLNCSSFLLSFCFPKSYHMRVAHERLRPGEICRLRLDLEPHHNWQLSD